MRKSKTILSCLLILGLILVLAGPLMATESVTLTGYLQDSDDGLVLKAGGETYLVEGNVPDWLVGQQIRVIGLVETDDQGYKYFIIDDFEEVQN